MSNYYLNQQEILRWSFNLQFQNSVSILAPLTVNHGVVWPGDMRRMRSVLPSSALHLAQVPWKKPIKFFFLVFFLTPASPTPTPLLKHSHHLHISQYYEQRALNTWWYTSSSYLTNNSWVICLCWVLQSGQENNYFLKTDMADTTHQLLQLKYPYNF